MSAAMAKAQGVLLAFVSALVLVGAGGAIFEIQNNCPFKVWAAGLPGGGKRLDRGQSWRLQVATGTARFWGRTQCSFNGNGSGSCNTGDCGALLNCQASGKPPATMTEFSLSQNNLDFYDISLVHGFNLPVSIIPSNSSCHAIACSSNISAIGPAKLRVSVGGGSTCTSFNTSQYCCRGQYSNNCSATNYSKMFKRQCRQASDDATSTFSCAGSNNFTILFCGRNAKFLQSQLSSGGLESIRAESSFGYC